LAVSGLLVVIGACGDDASSPGGDTTAADTQADTTSATSTDAASDTTGPACDKTGLTVVEQYLEYDPEADVTRYEAYSAGEKFDAILIQFYPPLSGEGASPLTGPGNYAIGANEGDRNFATCTTCVLALEGCSEDDCEKVYFATAGTIQVTGFDPEALAFKGTLVDATLVEVTIDEENTSTPVVDGDRWCIASFAFDSTPECTENADCTEPGKGVCDDETLTCVGCLTGFDCSAQAAACDQSTLACVPSIDDCTSDDANEPDDGPFDATALTLGQATSGAICDGVTQQELDWYTFTTTAEKNLSAKVTWTNADASFFVLFVNSERRIVGRAGEVGELVDEQVLALAPPGKYYAVVNPSDTSGVGDGTVAVAYSLTVTATDPECSSTVACAAGPEPVCDLARGECVTCVTSFDCDTAAPACVRDGANVTSCAKLDVCTGDDDPDDDDGPTVANALTVGAAATAAKICGDKDTASAYESDWYKFEATAGADLTLTVSWEGAPDIDVVVYDATGKQVGESLFEQPEEVDLVDLAAGTYYVEVFSYDGAETASIAYSIAVVATAP